MTTFRFRFEVLKWTVLLFTFVAPFPCVAQVSDAGDATWAEHSRSIELAQHFSEALVEDVNLPGFSAAVALNGTVIWSEGFGFSDLEQRVPVTPLTRYRVGSVSKPLTASAIGLLLERNQIDLDAPVQRYVKDFPEKQWPVNLRQIMGHTAGIRHYITGGYDDDEFLSTKAYNSVTDALPVFANDPLLFQPGSEFKYSTYGWTLVSAAIEGASGEAFLSFMQGEVFRPLGMRHTVAERMAPIIPYRVRYYERDDRGKLRNARYVDNSNKWAGGGFLSTPEDLVRFGNDHLRGGLLKPETVKLLKKPLQLTSGVESAYGLGWETRRDAHGRTIVGHGGGSVGGSTMFALWPEQSMVVVATTNITESPGMRLIAETLGEIFSPPMDSLDTSGRALDGAHSIRLHTEDGIAPLSGDLLLERTSVGYRGTLTVHPQIPRGSIIWGRDEPGELHILVATENRLVGICLNTEGELLDGRLLANSLLKGRLQPEGACTLVEGAESSD